MQKGTCNGKLLFPRYTVMPLKCCPLTFISEDVQFDPQNYTE